MGGVTEGNNYGSTVFEYYQGERNTEYGGFQRRLKSEGTFESHHKGAYVILYQYIAAQVIQDKEMYLC